MTIDAPYTLTSFSNALEEGLQHLFPDSIRLEAEIGELRVNRGHCYLNLVEKGKRSDTIVAQQRATIWAGNFAVLSAFFEQSTGIPLQTGLKVLLQCEVTYHALYGFSLNVVGIEPEYTLGALALARREIIQRLEREGIIDLNKQQELPLLPQRIAVISSATAAGYGDFMNHLSYNDYGYAFSVKLFPAIMQGKGAEASIINALDAVFEEMDAFDVVVLIRGGGATSDLSCFDSYELAAHIAQFPLPVIAGIGHQRDDTIADLVAHTKVKTPTAAADLLLNALANAEQMVNDLVEQMRDIVVQRLSSEQLQLVNMSHSIVSLAKNKLLAAASTLERQTLNISNAVALKLQRENSRLDLIERVVASYDPESMLKRGFAIIEQNGKMVRSVNQLQENDRVILYLHDGRRGAVIKDNE